MAREELRVAGTGRICGPAYEERYPPHHDRHRSIPWFSDRRRAPENPQRSNAAADGWDRISLSRNYRGIDDRQIRSIVALYPSEKPPALFGSFDSQRSF